MISFDAAMIDQPGRRGLGKKFDVPDHFDNRLIQSVATAKVRSMLLCPRPENST